MDKKPSEEEQARKGIQNLPLPSGSVGKEEKKGDQKPEEKKDTKRPEPIKTKEEAKEKEVVDVKYETILHSPEKKKSPVPKKDDEEEKKKKMQMEVSKIITYFFST